MGKQWKQWDGETVKTVADFIFLGSKITADGDCSYEIKRCLLLGRKVMTNLDSNIKEQRHYFADKGPYSQGYGFSSSHVWMWELDHKEGWATKNWCFWTVVLERFLRIPWTARRSNQSNLKQISPEYSLEGLCWSWNSNTSATWCEELTHWKRPWCWERLEAEEGDYRGWDGWITSTTPGVYPNSCPSSRWCHPAISSSFVPFSSCPQSLLASGSFPMSQLFAWGGQSIGVSASASFLQRTPRTDL